MSNRMKLGWTFTVLWVLLWVVLIFLDWGSAKIMTFNEWGDFFAGAFAPLAFLWLVIGYFQQGEELGQNTQALKQQERALNLQVVELKQSVEQQKELVKVATQELEMNSSNNAIQLEKEKLKAQPAIRYKSARALRGTNTSRKIQVKAINLGHSINVVTATLKGNPDYIKLGNDNLYSWDTDVEKSIAFTVIDKKVFDHDLSFEMHLSFLDGQGSASSQVLYYSVNSSGTLFFTPNPN